MPRRKYFENQTHHHTILLFNFCTAILAIMYLMVSKRKEWRSKFGGQDKDAIGHIKSLYIRFSIIQLDFYLFKNLLFYFNDSFL